MKAQKTNIVKKPVTGSRTPRLKPQSRVPDKQNKIPTKKNNISPLSPKTKEKSQVNKADQLPGDVFEQSELLLKRIKEEDGKIDLDQNVDLPWLEKIDSIEKSINENIAQSSAIDTSVVSNFAISSEKVEITDDPFSTVHNMIDSGFESISEQLSKESALLKERMHLISQIQEEIMKHPASEYTADLEPDETDIPRKINIKGAKLSKK